MAEVFEVTSAQLEQWSEDNGETFVCPFVKVWDRWLIAAVSRNSAGRFQVEAWPDLISEGDAVRSADETNAEALAELAEGYTYPILECEVWHVVDAMPDSATFEVRGKTLRDLDQLADALVALFRETTGRDDLTPYMDEDGRLDARDSYEEGFLWAAQCLRDAVGEIRSTCTSD